MQTFVPFDDLARCFSSLDNKRLLKQAIETCQIYDSISGKTKGWTNHPAVHAWKYNPGFLREYLKANIVEIQRRNYKCNYALEKLDLWPQLDSSCPAWWGSDVHFSHRCRLLQKPIEEFLKYQNWDKTTVDWYLDLNWQEANMEDLLHYEYLWPVYINSEQFVLGRKVSKESIKRKQAMHQIFSRGYLDIYASEKYIEHCNKIRLAV
jgi:hypothetical protein